MKKDTITVYWAPHSTPTEDGIGNWNMLYEDPQTLFKYWTQFSIKDEPEASMIQCPAFKNLAKNTYVFNSPIDTSYSFSAPSRLGHQIELTPQTKEYIAAFIPRNQTMSVGPNMEISLRLHMFAEEPLEVMLTGPYLHKTEYTKSGALTSGQFDIGQWFRPINCEIQLFGQEGTIDFKKDEPLFYVKFLTDKKIELKRFELTPELDTYAKKCIGAKSVFGLRKPLSFYYDKFMKTRTKDIVLKKIKENLI